MNALICLAALVAIAVVEANQQAWLDNHNQYRSKHHAGKVSWNSGAASKAKSWANKLASSGNFAHGNHDGLGQNIAMAWSSGTNKCSDAQIKSAVDRWYNEVKDYNYSTGKSNGGVTGHFTQVVWKGTSAIGCGCGASSHGVYTVCNYKPPGNWGGEYTKNVQKP